MAKKKKKEKPGPKPKGTMKKVHIQIYEPEQEIEDKGGMPYVRQELKKAYQQIPVKKKVKK